jgi:hypothetical protein
VAGRANNDCGDGRTHRIETRAMLTHIICVGSGPAALPAGYSILFRDANGIDRMNTHGLLSGVGVAVAMMVAFIAPAAQANAGENDGPFTTPAGSVSASVAPVTLLVAPTTHDTKPQVLVSFGRADAEPSCRSAVDRIASPATATSHPILSLRWPPGIGSP